MDQMYAMGATIHSFWIVLLSLNSMLVAAAIFMGTIMMAAKHLDFIVLVISAWMWLFS